MRPGSDQNAAHWASKRPTALEWLAAIVVALAALAYFVFVPLAKVAVSGAARAVGGIVHGIAQGVAAIAEAGYEDARQRIEKDPLVIAMLGQPVVCQPIEQSTFQGGQASEEFEIVFDVVGPRGRATAHVVLRVTDAKPLVAQIVVSGDQHSVQVPTP